MRLSKHRRNHRLLMNMTPMIDIVFLLIIFFMTVSQITRVNEERMELPQLKGIDEQATTTLTINITSDGLIKITGDEKSIAETLMIVGKELEKVGGESSRVRILLRTDKRALNAKANELLRQLSQLGIQQVRIGVEARQ